MTGPMMAKNMGRGQTHKFRTKPICPRKGIEQFRVDPLMNQLCGIKALIEQRRALMVPTRGRLPQLQMINANAKSIAAMQQGLTGDTDMQPALSRLASMIRYIHKMNLPAINKICDHVDKLIERANKAMTVKNRAAYHLWVARALENGASMAHKWCTQQPKAPPLPTYSEAEGVTLYHPIEKALHYKGVWAKQWGRYKAEYDEMLKAIKDIATESRSSAGDTLPAITAEMVREGIKEIKLSTALGLDQWDVKWLRALSGEALASLACVLNMVEACCAWPQHILTNTIVLMGKPQPIGGCRPIALMPMVYRIWTKVRKPWIQEWDALNSGPWDAAVKGSSALRAAVLSQFQDEIHFLNGGEVGTILWDMAKFYDNIPIPKLVGRARDMGYPTAIVAAGLIMHMCPRVLKAYDHYEPCCSPSNGIIAGCTQSTYWARMFLFAVMKTAVESFPQTLRTFIDDVSQKVHTEEEDSMAEIMVPAATALAKGFTDLGCVISDKTVIVTRSKTSMKKIQDGLRRRKVHVSTAYTAKI